jgi:hypothetical protein
VNGWTRRAIQSVGGRSLTFASGDYITIAFATNGGSSKFYGANVSSINGPISIDIARQQSGSTDYTSAPGFPEIIINDNLSSTGIIQRIAFELY